MSTEQHNRVVDHTHQAVIDNALEILETRMKYHSPALSNPTDVKNYLMLKLAERESEVFSCLYLDNKHQVIEFVELFYGTIDGCSVHPREIVKQALALNAAAVIFAHNHPSGAIEPSTADEFITTRLKSALDLVDINVLDHFIIGGTAYCSFAENYSD